MALTVRGGTPLNRTSGAATFYTFPQLSIVAANLGKGGITLSLDEDLVDIHQGMTRTKNSPKAYVMATLTIDLMKDIGVTNLWQSQWLIDSQLGDGIVYPDSKALSPITFENGAIKKIEAMPFNGEDPTVKITIGGFVAVNALLFTGI